jgi:hypothetical protein
MPCADGGVQKGPTTPRVSLAASLGVLAMTAPPVVWPNRGLDYGLIWLDGGTWPFSRK